MMNVVAMRDEIVKVYGKDSHEGGFAQYLFSRRPSEVLARYYNEVVTNKATYTRKAVA